MTKQPTWTVKDLETLAAALEVAARQYLHDARDNARTPRIVEQFTAQAYDAQALRERLANEYGI